MIPFNKPCLTGNEKRYVLESINSSSFSGNGNFTKKCEQWFELTFKNSSSKYFLVTSCTHALEIAALLINIKPNDEVIMPSYTFVSTANAFVLRGAKIVFVDIESSTMNMDVSKVEQAITNKTKAIVPVHYAGVACDMDKIMNIANKHNLYVIEDSAQGMMSSYKGKPLGTIGHLGAYSFHETKNYTSGGEGGLLIVNDKSLYKRTHNIRDKGTNRNEFLHGLVDKYSWVDLGSSYVLSDLSAAYLYAQLQEAGIINEKRLESFKKYYSQLNLLSEEKIIELPYIPNYAKHNAHIFYIKVKNIKVRNELIQYLKNENISSVFHYVPLHSSLAGKKFGRFVGKDAYTTTESEKIIRLPMYYGIKEAEINKVCEVIYEFFNELKI